MNNNKGQGLIGLLVTMSVNVIIMTGLAMMIATHTRAINTVNTNADITAFLTTLRVNLNTGMLATGALKGNAVVAGGTIVIYDPLDATKIMAGANIKQQTTDSWQVQSISVASAVAVPSYAKLYRLSLVANILKDKTRNIGYNVSKKIIGDVYCTLDSHNYIVDCLGATDTVTLAQQVCGSLDGTWNSSTAKCVTNSGDDSGGACGGMDNGNHNGQH